MYVFLCVTVKKIPLFACLWFVVFKVNKGFCIGMKRNMGNNGPERLTTLCLSHILQTSALYNLLLGSQNIFKEPPKCFSDDTANKKCIVNHVTPSHFCNRDYVHASIMIMLLSCFVG